MVSGLLAAFAAVCHRLTREQYLSFVRLLTYECPATSTLLALSSHLSMVAPVVPKKGVLRGEPGGPTGIPLGTFASLNDSAVVGMECAAKEQAHGMDQSDQHMSSIKEVVVQPIKAEFVAQILALRVQPGFIEPQMLLPQHLHSPSGERRSREEVCSCGCP